MRKHLREVKSERIGRVLAEFKDLQRIDELRSVPIREKTRFGDRSTSPVDFAEFLASIYSSDSIFQTSSVAAYLRQCAFHGFGAIPQFIVHEVHAAVKAMRNRRCADEAGMVADMSKHAPDALLERLREICNTMLTTGSIEPSWRHTASERPVRPGGRPMKGAGENGKPIMSTISQSFQE